MFITINGETTMRKSKETIELALKKQIKEGKEILRKEIRTENDLKNAKAEGERWEDYTKTLIETLFKGARCWHSPLFFSVIGLSSGLSREIRKHKNDIEKTINELQSVHDRLGLLKPYKQPSAISKIIQATKSIKIWKVEWKSKQKK